jgi:hypothetical protein
MKIHPGFRSNLTGIAVLSREYSDNYLRNVMIIRGFGPVACQQLAGFSAFLPPQISEEKPLQEGIGVALSETLERRDRALAARTGAK